MAKKKTQKQIHQDKVNAGRAGGLATVRNHGQDHMRTIGKRGATRTWTLYSKGVYGTYQHAMYDRETGKIIAIIGRAPRMQTILEEE